MPTKTQPDPADVAAAEFAAIPQASLEEAAKRIFAEEMVEAGPEPDHRNVTPVFDEETPTNITPILEEPQRKTLHQKLADVMFMVERIPKNGRAPAAMGGFEFVQVGDAAAAIRRELAYHHITMMPTDIQLLAQTEHESKTGGVMTTETYRVQWTFVDGDSSERHVVYSVGSGADRGDKAAPKAQTNAMKYALLMAFLMPTGDDPEQEDSSDRQTSRRRGTRTRDDVVIEDSSVTGVRQGGRQEQSTQAQIAEIGRFARKLKLGPLALAAILNSVLPSKPVPDFADGSSTSEKTALVLEYLRTLDHEEAASVVRVLMDSKKEDADGVDEPE